MTTDQDKNEEAIEALRSVIRERGWEDSIRFITGDIEFVSDLCSSAQLSLDEMRKFVHETRINFKTVAALDNGGHAEEIGRLSEVVSRFNAATASRREARAHSGDDQNRRVWSLSSARAWRDDLDRARHVFEQSCQSLRFHLDGALAKHRERALKCIEEMEHRIPLLYSGRLADVPQQREAINQIVLLSVRLFVYADDHESLERFSNYIVPAGDEQAAFRNMAAFCQAVMGDDLGGQQDWLKQVDSLEWVRAEAQRLASVYEQDGRLNSDGKLIREQALRDPLGEDPDELSAAGSLDKASFEMAEHPDVRAEIQDLDGVLKHAGLNPKQRKSLLLRRNGEITSHKDINEWKRSQRAINGRRSELVKAISAATKKRIIKAPRISAGSDSGVIREGGGYTRPLADEQEQKSKRSARQRHPLRWFDTTPPPIARSKRKSKHLFKRMSTDPTL